MRETKEEFLARYPRPRVPESMKDDVVRVLVHCNCGYEKCTGWAWGRWYFDTDKYGFDHGLALYETLAEDAPTR